MISHILALLTGLFILGFDQYTKALVVKNFSVSESKEFINGLIDFVFVKNEGAAWGILSGQTWLLLLITISVMLICIVFLIKYALKNKLLFWAITLVLFGGIGNMIDRIFRGGFVVDFLHFEFWPQFPVFNIADCSIVVGAGLLILYFIIDIYKEFNCCKKVTESVVDNDEN